MIVSTLRLLGLLGLSHLLLAYGQPQVSNLPRMTIQLMELEQLDRPIIRIPPKGKPEDVAEKRAIVAQKAEPGAIAGGFYVKLQEWYQSLSL